MQSHHFSNGFEEHRVVFSPCLNNTISIILLGQSSLFISLTMARLTALAMSEILFTTTSLRFHYTELVPCSYMENLGRHPTLGTSALDKFQPIVTLRPETHVILPTCYAPSSSFRMRQGRTFFGGYGKFQFHYG